MRWNCPHCGVALAVADEKLGNGWTFSRCYKCARFALLRKAEVNLIKVDKAPPDGNFLLPENSDGLLSKPANDRLNQLGAKKIPVAPHSQIVPMPASLAPPPTPIPTPMPMPMPMQQIPEPMPEVIPTQRHSIGLRMLPVAIGFTLAMTVGSGAYLFMQGQAVWQKARETHDDQQTVSAASPIRDFANEKPLSREPETPVTPAPAPSSAAPAVPGPSRPRITVRTASAGGAASIGAVTSLIVEIKTPTAKLRSGPGLQFPVQAMVHENLRLSVSGFRDRWFQVIVPTESLASSEEPAAKEVQPQQTGLVNRQIMPNKPQLMWVRNDLVRLVQPNESDD